MLRKPCPSWRVFSLQCASEPEVEPKLHLPHIRSGQERGDLSCVRFVYQVGGCVQVDMVERVKVFPAELYRLFLVDGEHLGQRQVNQEQTRTDKSVAADEASHETDDEGFVGWSGRSGSRCDGGIRGSFVGGVSGLRYAERRGENTRA